MTNIEFVEKARNIAINYRTYYAWGTWGWSMNQKNIDRIMKQYPAYFDNADRVAFQNDIGKAFMFDCIGLVKGLLWGWNGDMSRVYGGAGYSINGVPDTDAQGMLNYCNGVSNDFSNIKNGEFLWLDGHCGIFMAPYFCIESTPAWNGGVQITTVNNIVGNIKGYSGRTWLKHGKINVIDYNEVVQAPVVVAPIVEPVIEPKPPIVDNSPIIEVITPSEPEIVVNEPIIEDNEVVEEIKVEESTITIGNGKNSFINWLLNIVIEFLKSLKRK